MNNRRNKKTKFPIKEFLKELLSGVILILIVFLLFLVGFVIVNCFPQKLSNIFTESVEFVILIGFFVLLLVLYLISKFVQLFQQINAKVKSLKMEEKQDIENTNE